MRCRIGHRRKRIGELDQSLVPLTVAEVAERLARLAVVLEEMEQRQERRGDSFALHKIGEDKIEPFAEELSTDKDRVAVFGFADERDIGIVRSRTAVRTSGHADGKRLLLQPEPREFDFQLVHDPRQRAFTFRNRQSARRPCDARHRPAPDGRNRFARSDIVPAKNVRDGVLAFAIEAAQQQALVRRDADAGTDFAANRSHCRLDALLTGIGNPTVSILSP